MIKLSARVHISRRVRIRSGFRSWPGGPKSYDNKVLRRRRRNRIAKQSRRKNRGRS